MMSEGANAGLKGLKAELGKESRQLHLNFDELKSGGFIKQVQKNLFTVRLRCPGGKVTSERMNKAAEIAEKYGRGEVHISVRQSIEVPYVSYEHFNAVVGELKDIEWSVASCGPRVRVPTACAGCTYNPNGITDTQAVCAEIDKRYFGTPTGHHKFKMSLSGCPIDCFRTREMDLGFQGMMEPGLVAENCTSCGLCVKGCEDGALRMENGIPVRDWSKCVFCGDCVKVCPSDAMVSKRIGWLARVGGKHGKHPYTAYEVANFLTDHQVYTLIEKTVEWYQKNGSGRERIGAAIERVGLERYIDEVVVPMDVEVVHGAKDRMRYYSRGNSYNSDSGARVPDERVQAPEPISGQAAPAAQKNKLNGDGFVDITDVICPITFVKTKVAIEELEDGQLLEVRMNEGEPIQNVPRSLKEEGHKVVQVINNEDGTYTILVEKGGL